MLLWPNWSRHVEHLRLRCSAPDGPGTKIHSQYTSASYMAVLVVSLSMEAATMRRLELTHSCPLHSRSSPRLRKLRQCFAMHPISVGDRRALSSFKFESSSSCSLSLISVFPAFTQKPSPAVWITLTYPVRSSTSSFLHPFNAICKSSTLPRSRLRSLSYLSPEKS